MMAFERFSKADPGFVCEHNGRIFVTKEFLQAVKDEIDKLNLTVAAREEVIGTLKVDIGTLSTLKTRQDLEIGRLWNEVNILKTLLTSVATEGHVVQHLLAEYDEKDSTLKCYIKGESPAILRLDQEEAEALRSLDAGMKDGFDAMKTVLESYEDRRLVEVTKFTDTVTDAVESVKRPVKTHDDTIYAAISTPAKKSSSSLLDLVKESIGGVLSPLKIQNQIVDSLINPPPFPPDLSRLLALNLNDFDEKIFTPKMYQTAHTKIYIQHFKGKDSGPLRLKPKVTFSIPDSEENVLSRSSSATSDRPSPISVAEQSRQRILNTLALQPSPPNIMDEERDESDYINIYPGMIRDVARTCRAAIEENDDITEETNIADGLETPCIRTTTIRSAYKVRNNTFPPIPVTGQNNSAETGLDSVEKTRAYPDETTFIINPPQPSITDDDDDDDDERDESDYINIFPGMIRNVAKTCRAAIEEDDDITEEKSIANGLETRCIRTTPIRSASKSDTFPPIPLTGQNYSEATGLDFVEKTTTAGAYPDETTLIFNPTIEPPPYSPDVTEMPAVPLEDFDNFVKTPKMYGRFFAQRREHSKKERNYINHCNNVFSIFEDGSFCGSDKRTSDAANVDFATSEVDKRSTNSRHTKVTFTNFPKVSDNALSSSGHAEQGLSDSLTHYEKYQDLVNSSQQETRSTNFDSNQRALESPNILPSHYVNAGVPRTEENLDEILFSPKLFTKGPTQSCLPYDDRTSKSEESGATYIDHQDFAVSVNGEYVQERDENSRKPTVIKTKERTDEGVRHKRMETECQAKQEPKVVRFLDDVICTETIGTGTLPLQKVPALPSPFAPNLDEFLPTEVLDEIPFIQKMYQDASQHYNLFDAASTPICEDSCESDVSHTGIIASKQENSYQVTDENYQKTFMEEVRTKLADECSKIESGDVDNFFGDVEEDDALLAFALTGETIAETSAETSEDEFFEAKSSAESLTELYRDAVTATLEAYKEPRREETMVTFTGSATYHKADTVLHHRAGEKDSLVQAYCRAYVSHLLSGAQLLCVHEELRKRSSNYDKFRQPYAKVQVCDAPGGKSTVTAEAATDVTHGKMTVDTDSEPPCEINHLEIDKVSREIVHENTAHAHKSINPDSTQEEEEDDEFHSESSLTTQLSGESLEDEYFSAMSFINGASENEIYGSDVNKRGHGVVSLMYDALRSLHTNSAIGKDVRPKQDLLEVISRVVVQNVMSGAIIQYTLELSRGKERKDQTPTPKKVTGVKTDGHRKRSKREKRDSITAKKRNLEKRRFTLMDRITTTLKGRKSLTPVRASRQELDNEVAISRKNIYGKTVKRSKIRCNPFSFCPKKGRRDANEKTSDEEILWREIDCSYDINVL